MVGYFPSLCNKKKNLKNSKIEKVFAVVTSKLKRFRNKAEDKLQGMKGQLYITMGKIIPVR